METITAIVDFIHKTRNYYDQFNRQYYVDGVAQYNLKKLTVTAALDDDDFMQGIDDYLQYLNCYSGEIIGQSLRTPTAKVQKRVKKIQTGVVKLEAKRIEEQERGGYPFNKVLNDLMGGADHYFWG